MVKLAVVPGADLLASFLSEKGLRYGQAGEALGVSRVTVYHWACGMKRPRDHHRKLIAIYTQHAVPETAWETEEERCAQRRIESLSSVAATGTEG